MTLDRVQKIRKLIVLVILVLFFLLICVSGPVYVNEQVSITIKGFGAALIVFCIAGRVWTIRYIGGRKINFLMTDGPYSICRNPLYVFSIIGAVGIGLLSGSAIPGLLLGAAAASVFTVVVKLEEAVLLTTHGDGFRDYVAVTPRFLPSLSRWSVKEKILVSSGHVARTLLDSALMLTAIPAFMLIAYAQKTGLLPVLLRLP